MKLGSKSEVLVERMKGGVLLTISNPFEDTLAVWMRPEEAVEVATLILRAKSTSEAKIKSWPTRPAKKATA